MIKNLHALLLVEKLRIIWRTGLPLRVGLFNPGSGIVPGIPAIGALHGDTIWLDRTLLKDPLRLRNVVEHEVLHVRCALLRRSVRKSQILQRAGASAYALASADHEMGQLLQRYENAGQDAHEEALVILVASGARVACPEVKKAAQLLRLSAGCNPLNLLRALCWLPVIVWTRHGTPGTPFS